MPPTVNLTVVQERAGPYSLTGLDCQTQATKPRSQYDGVSYWTQSRIYAASVISVQ